MKALRECHADVIEIYGYGIQVIGALLIWHDFLRKQISSGTKKSNRMFFGKGDPNLPGAKSQYQRDYGYLLDSSVNNGPLSVTHRRSVVTLLYSDWEHKHRPEIAKELGFEKSQELESDVFQDIGVYRRAILHRGNKLQKDPEVFRFFGKGEGVSLTSDHIDTIFRGVVDELNRIGREYYGTDPQFSFDQPMN